MPRSSSRSSRSSSKRRAAASMLFERRNYMLMVASVAIVALGYAIMRIENSYQGTLSLYVAPVLIVGGYVGVAAAILWRPSSGEDSEQAAAQEVSQDG